MDKRDVVRKQTAPDAASVLAPALKFGAFTGSAGLLVGGVAGVVRGTPAVFFAAASGIQWFGLGTTYWGSRTFILQAWDTGHGVTQSERVSASTAAGAVAGSGIGLLTRGPKNVIPGGIMFSLFGFLGQHIYNIGFDKSTQVDALQDGEVRENVFQRFAKRKWSPFSVLTDEQYRDMLGEKLLRIDAEISLIDDRIADLRIKEKEWAVAEAESEKAQALKKHDDGEKAV